MHFPLGTEFQFDSSLFKRSISKAMDTNWINNDTTTNVRHANKFYHRSSLGVIRNRSSCIDISQLGSSLGKVLTNKKNIDEINHTSGIILHI